jgi:hypothetical protein
MNSRNLRREVGTRHRILTAVVLALALGACKGGSGSSSPSLRALSVSPGTSYLATGVTLQLAATGQDTSGATVPVTSGVRWESSDAQVATVSDTGLVTAVAGGSVTVKATYVSSGLVATAAVTSRSMISLNVGTGSFPSAGAVDTTRAGYRLTGLTPGSFYTVSVDQLQDDLDLEVYGDASLSDAAQLCVSQTSGLFPEDCLAPANASGELYVQVDGQWTASGSTFSVNVAAQAPATLGATLAFPGGLPYAGSVRERDVYKVTGLTAGASYTVGLTHLADDADLEVFGDAVLYTSLCASSASGKANDACAATASAAGELYVVVENEGQADSTAFTLEVSAR